MEEQNSVKEEVQNKEIKEINKLEENEYISEQTNNNNEHKSKNEPKKIGIIEVIILLIITMTVSMSLGMIIVGQKNKVKKPEEPKDKYLETFIENYNFIVDNYYQDIDKQQLINDAIAGMMNTLDDPYSAYIEGDEADNFNINLQGSYKGLGVSIVKDPETNYIMIYYTFDNSPAAKAGLKTGDIIKKVDDTLTDTIETSEFSSQVLKSEKNDYTLTIIRDGEEFEVNISKENVTIDSVKSEIIEKEDKKIGYIYMSIFASNTDIQFKQKLEELETEGIDALIIDVRSNTGGHLTAVESILKSLLTKKQVTYKLDDNGNISEYYGSLNKNKDYEIVLLGDKYSASASEVLIYSLKDNLNSKLIGTKTYGKGTVQELITLPSGVQYKITTKKWLSPKGSWVNDTEGIEPDIEVEMNEEYYQNRDNDHDNQLQTAIDYILNEEK